MMRNKDKSDWHNFEPGREIRLGEITSKVCFNNYLKQRFIDYSKDRISRNTGIRFKFNVFARQLLESIDETKYVYFDLIADKPYVFPNKSSHTDIFDSHYCRVEFYIEKNDFNGIGTDERYGEIELALSLNAVTLKDFVCKIEAMQTDSGFEFCFDGIGSEQEVKKYCGEYVSFQVFKKSASGLINLIPQVYDGKVSRIDFKVPAISYHIV